MGINFNDPFIMEFDNACPDKLCDELINFCDANKPDPFFMSKDHDIKVAKKVKTSVDIPLNLNIQEQMILNNKCQNILRMAVLKYADILVEKSLGNNSYDIKNSIQTNVVVQKSEVGQYYHWHSDWAPNSNRLLTCILYLNTLDEDAGGTTDFMYGRSIKPKKGKILIFPSSINYIHRGDTLKNGSKYIVTTFSIYNNQTSYFPFIIKH